MTHCFEGASADEVWRQAAETLLTHPAVTTQQSRAGETRELLHVVLEISDPVQRWVGSRREALNIAFALAEVIWILGGRNDSAFLNYFNSQLPKFAGHGPTYDGAYGERMRSRFGLDQLKQAAAALRANPQSRQVVLQIWHAPSDLPGADGQPASPDVPCNLVSMLKVRDGLLDWTQVMRSNDAYRGVPHNLVQFTTLQEVMAGWIGIRPGRYTHWSDSLHFYTKDLAGGTMLNNSATVGKNTDSLALAQPEFDGAWPTIRAIADSVTDHKVTGDQLLSLVTSAGIPHAWSNILRVIAAEGLRRRGASSELALVMEPVTNPAYQDLWTRWFQRMGGK